MLAAWGKRAGDNGVASTLVTDDVELFDEGVDGYLITPCFAVKLLSGTNCVVSVLVKIRGSWLASAKCIAHCVGP